MRLSGAGGGDGLECSMLILSALRIARVLRSDEHDDGGWYVKSVSVIAWLLYAVASSDEYPHFHGRFKLCYTSLSALRLSAVKKVPIAVHTGSRKYLQCP